MAFTQITVTGTYTREDGTPASGEVYFQLSAPMQDTSTGTVIPATQITATLDANGSFSKVLYATDDPTTTPTGCTYRVQEFVQGSGYRLYNIALAHTLSSPVKLSSLTPVTNTQTFIYALLANNLSDLTSKATGRKNLGSGAAYTQATMPAAGDAGRLLVQSDGIPGTYVDVGSQLVLVAGGALNVKMGSTPCKGDGTTLDTTALSNYVTAAATNNVPLYIPTGTYLIDDDLPAITSPLRIFGDHKMRSILLAKSGSTIGKMLTYGDGTNNILWNDIRDLKIDGNNVAQYGIYLTNKGFIRGTMRNVGVQNCLGSPGIGISTQPGSPSNNYDMLFDNVEVTNCNIGLQLTGLIQGGRMISCKVFSNVSNELILGDGFSQIAIFTIIASQFESDDPNDTHVNLLVNSVGSLNLQGIYSESHATTSHCLEVVSNTLATQFTQINIDGWYADGVGVAPHWCVLPSDNTRVYLRVKNLNIRRFAGEWITNSRGPNKHVEILSTEDTAVSPTHLESGSFSTPYAGLAPATNLLKQSQTFATLPWTGGAATGGTAPTVTQSGTAPDGTATSYLITFGTPVSNLHNGTTLQNQSGITLCFSLWMKSDSGGPVVIRIYSGGNSVGQARTVLTTTQWQRYWVVWQPSDNGFINVDIENQATGTGVANAASVYVWGAQLEQASAPGAYIPTTSTTQTQALIPFRGPVYFAGPTYRDFVAVTDPGTGTITFDLSQGNKFYCILTGSRTINLSNARVGMDFVLVLQQGGSGSNTVTWGFSTIKWSGGSAPTLATTVGQIDQLGFSYLASSTYLGSAPPTFH